MTLDIPPTYLLATNLRPEEVSELENRIPSLTRKIGEARIILGKITKRERAQFELRRLKLQTEEIPAPGSSNEHETKRRKISDAHDGQGAFSVKLGLSTTYGAVDEDEARAKNTVKVLRLSWLTDSLDKGVVLPYDEYLLYHGRKVSQEATTKRFGSPPSPVRAREILERATQEGARLPASSKHSAKRTHDHGLSLSHPPALIRQTTSEHDKPLPPVPDFLHTTYSCQRPTPVTTPNADFIDQLKEVRILRLLEGDQIGVRAYSSSIASLAAYPHKLASAQEVSRLPGCGSKIAELYQHWIDTGAVKEVKDAESDSRLSVLKVFYDIWGVGDHTAREFYKKGWRDLDDLVEYGWDSLSRVQQIGVKFYEDFQKKIPRNEVEAIAGVVLLQARQVDAGMQMTIVGGYRRGKSQSGDVDIVLSHPDESQTLRLVEKVVLGLERDRYITHTLSLTTRNSERGQAPLPWRGEGIRSSHAGFDTLDKAMVVWQDPSRRDAPRRRVDIIVSPWKTAGCAVLGWSGGTTFQRDLRLFCKRERKLKFDSSGIRSREDGRWVDMESGPPPAADMETAERRVFEGLGLAYQAPEQRCTG